MSTKKYTPKIRFAGFTDDWEQRKLGEIVEIVMGQSPSSRNYTDNPNDFILVQGNADIKNGFVYPRVWTKEITKTTKKGTLIFSVRAPVGDIAKTNYDVVLGRGVASLNGNEFIYQTLSKIKISGFWEKLSSGSTFESINSNDIRNAEIYIPSQEEQAAIGNFFKQLDETIALHQREAEKYKNLKNSYLEKMFPIENEQFPRLRFPNFTDAWEQRKLGEVLKIKSGMSQKDIEVENGIYPILATGGEIGRTNTALCYKESVLIGRKGTIDKPFYMSTPFWTVDTLFYSELGSYVTGQFIYTLFQKIKWRDFDTSTGVPSLTSSTIHNIEVSIPPLAEQTAIGNFFKQLDETIALHQRKADKFKQIKQFYLEKMFV